MKEKIINLITSYRSRIAKLQSTIHFYERDGRAGACINVSGKIEAYNAVIKDLMEVIK